MEVIEINSYQPLLAGSYDVNTDIGIEGGSGGDEPAMAPGLDDAGIFGIPSFLFE